MVKLKSILILILVSTLIHSCVIFDFVGGHGIFAAFPIEANFDEVLVSIDELAERNKNLLKREFYGSVYDKGRYRNYSLVNHNINFSIKLLGFETGWRERSDYSEIVLTHLKINNVQFDPDDKIKKEDKELYNNSILIIKKEFIEPVRLTIRNNK